MVGKVHIIDDDEALRDSLYFLLKSHNIVPIIYESGMPFLRQDLSAIRSPILLDIRMPGKDGIGVLKDAMKKNSALKIIMMSGHADIATAVKAVKLGAIDFLEKPFGDDQLLPKIYEAQSRIKSEILAAKERESLTQALHKLTPREREVMERLVDGMANKVIARQLGLSVRTIETHRAHLMSKLDVKSVSDLVKIELSIRP
ncbi:MAG: response regulator transcription factor [Alphaproteobacteria bacterium]